MKENKPTQIVINGDNIELLKKYPNNYFDSVVTDCPYGLGKEPNAEEMLGAWIKSGYLEVKGSGFMGKEWDSFVPQPIFWKEIYRVLKFGGHIVAFFGTRTYDWGCMAIRLGGFEIRDCIQWVYGSGFPKSHNIGKAVDKLNIKENTDWNGWGSALKPANEPIVLARKPLEKGLSIAENMLKWGTGGINIDGCRIGNDTIPQKKHIGNSFSQSYKENGGANYENLEWEYKQGRFPSNFIMSHHEDCEDLICVDDCPIKILDEQSGTLNQQGVSKSDNKRGWQKNFVGGGGVIAVERKLYLDKGGASRFFYVSKASQWERSFGLDEFEEKHIAWSNQAKAELKRGNNDFADEVKMFNKIKLRKNSHPTIKPIELMQYLVRLVTQPNGIVLDAYAGSGTTGIACKIDGFNFVGLEISQEYTDIANQRIKSFNEEKLLLKQTKIFKNKDKKKANNLTELPFE